MSPKSAPDAANVHAPPAEPRTTPPQPATFPIHVRRTTLVPLMAIVVVPLVVAYAQWAMFGLPAVPAVGHFTPATATGPYGFAAWICITHYVNLLFMVLLIRSGLQILMDHPRLYWNAHCTPGTEWIRFTPVKVPLDRLYTAKDDARNLTPLIGIPGGRHTLGLARHWHFISPTFALRLFFHQNLEF